MQWLTIEGNHYEIGYQLGYWWGIKLRKLETNEYGRRFLAKCREGCYRKELAHGWKDIYLPLFRSVLHSFPEIIEEIAGMANGVKDTGIQTSMLDMFSLVLGETEDQHQSCSAFVVKAGNETILAHNEEEAIRYPLCFARVRLKVNGNVKTFVSVSYPFQLFGSCVGMNKNISFQGNSIGCKDQITQLQSTWYKRLPKTVFSRRLLELSNINEIKQLFGRHHCTLPTHNYVIHDGNRYSLEVRPKLNLKVGSPKQQLTLRKHSKHIHTHTNHFHRKGVNEGIWRWGNECQESLDRYKLLNKLLKDNDVSQTSGCMNVLRRMQNCYSESTCASIVIKKSARSTLHGIYYFHEKPIKVPPVTL